MNDISSQHSLKPRRLILRTLLIGVSIVAVLAFLSFFVWRFWLRLEVNRQIAAIRAEGLPTDWPELFKWSGNVPDSQNGALLYLIAIEELHADKIPTLKLYEPDLLPRREALNDDLRQELTAIVETNGLALVDIHKAAGWSKSLYPIDSDTLGAQLLGLKKIACLLECEAVLKADGSDFDGAADSISASMAAARSLDASPHMISQYVAIYMMATAVDSFKRVLNRGPVSGEWLSKLSALMVSAERPQRFVTAVIGERAANNGFIESGSYDIKRMNDILRSREASQTEEDMIPANWGGVLRTAGFFARDRIFFLKAMETNLMIARLTPPASLAMSGTMNEVEGRARNGFYICSSLLLPDLIYLPARDAEFRAQLRIASTVANIERWRLEHYGKIPESLTMLVPSLLPEIPSDPFDGQPLRFKRLALGYVVYSIGRDMKDDGGKERPLRSEKIPLAEKNQYDITFTVER